ncbi:hypothetical protein BJX76DRAFT_351804 [Aspergillus varians]
MPKRPCKTKPCGPQKRRRKDSAISRTQSKRTNPFEILPWDCANLVLQFLDVQDLARCEQVGRSWRDFVQLWLVDIGHQYCLPDRWRPDTVDPIFAAEAFNDIKKSAVQYAAHRKFTSGKASCARRYQTSATGLFDISGDYTVWHSGENIFWQDLSFRRDGTLHPANRLAVRVAGDNLRYLAVNAEGYVYYQICRPNNQLDKPEDFRHYMVRLQTGEKLWKRHAKPDTKLFAFGKDRVYLVGTGLHNRYLTARDIKSGKLLYEVPFLHPVRRSKSPVTVQLHGGAEVLVHIHSVLFLANIFIVDGIQIINGADGRILQTIPTRIWTHGSQIIPQTDKKGSFALLSHFRTTKWYVKIQKFTQIPSDGTFHIQCTEVLELGKYPDQINQIGIEPYRYVAVSLEGRRALPRVMSIQENPTPTIDRRTLPVGTASSTDKWLRIGPAREVTLPQKYKHHKVRRLFIPGPLDYGPSSCRVNFASCDRIVLFTEPRQFYCLFDFRFRLPCNAGSKVTPDPRTLEMR